jgi:hypothetical protein
VREGRRLCAARGRAAREGRRRVGIGRGLAGKGAARDKVAREGAARDGLRDDWISSGQKDVEGKLENSNALSHMSDLHNGRNLTDRGRNGMGVVKI